ncbi:hypothetical protein Nepgr_008057 [Nepenthes gracilis]|uniref:Uncharacterized protein n=1 Tax=Nepenthes gracilis TaxID=150966 RepID=A0AAD3S819_NEPGR|nr:hypothetical protein Nepgr_008057 [Nepenthes gracilis]
MHSCWLVAECAPGVSAGCGVIRISFVMLGWDVYKESRYWVMILPLAENLQNSELQSGYGLGSKVCIDAVVYAEAFCS